MNINPSSIPLIWAGFLIGRIVAKRILSHYAPSIIAQGILIRYGDFLIVNITRLKLVVFDYLVTFILLLFPYIWVYPKG